MPPNDEINEFREQFYAMIKETYAKFNAFEEKVTGEITEYKKTVNTAITSLSKELFQYQEKEDKHRAKRQKVTDRIHYGIIGIGCLVVGTSCVLFLALLYLIWLLRFA